MSNTASLEEIEKQIRNIHDYSDSSDEQRLIEAYLRQKLERFSSGDRIAALEKLISRFTEVVPEIRPEMSKESGSRLFSLLLGRKVSVPDLSSPEATEKLARSLDVIFDGINQIVCVIHATLLGEKIELETIRHRIGASLENKDGLNSLQGYLDQIRVAFLISHEAFKAAIQTKVAEILNEIDPDRIATTVEGGLKFGPLRKAELFEVYKEKFKACDGWFKSGRFLEEVLRAFEKNCQTKYKMRNKEVL